MLKTEDQNRFELLAPIALILSVYAYIFLVLLNHYHSWMHYEISDLYAPYILSGSTEISIEELMKALNSQVMEMGVARIRVLSGFFLVLNEKFRLWLWQFMAPHPSLSLGWIFAFGLAPLFLYKTVKNLFKSRYIALLGVAIYVCMPGSLSNTVQYFHPGKTLVQFFFILSLFLGTEIVKNLPKEGQRTKSFYIKFSLLVVTVFTSLFSGENAFFIGVALPLLCPLLFFRKDLQDFSIPIMFSLLVPVGVIAKFILPHLSVSFGYQPWDIFSYVSGNSFVNFSLFHWTQTLSFSLRDNLLIDALNPSYFIDSKAKLHSLLTGLWQISFFWLALSAFFPVFKTKDLRNFLKESILVRIIAILILYSFFYSILLTRALIVFDGWWYGGPISIFVAILICGLLRIFYESKKQSLIVFLMALFYCSSLLIHQTDLNLAHRYFVAREAIKWEEKVLTVHDIVLGKVTSKELVRKLRSGNNAKTHRDIAKSTWVNRKQNFSEAAAIRTQYAENYRYLRNRQDEIRRVEHPDEYFSQNYLSELYFLPETE